MDRWGTLGNVKSISKEEASHSVTSISFFDRVKHAGFERKLITEQILLLDLMEIL